MGTIINAAQVSVQNSIANIIKINIYVWDKMSLIQFLETSNNILVSKMAII